ncbi:hypothetical protein [Mycolicibacterium peregrinum]|uniref:Uncharacterized protein n=1 Tax=Mycolicibacterium peregrinum TaxID=43304 RepID=A0A4Z0HMG3_MYCPR|nr:hypothetical protein [Mycolicibacterium peregrinum]TGB37922.1 hypothetical protein EJD98_25585 [Mycolicibacterium peregrinum]TGB38058.1 hypothetical protein EJD94_24980 [Mycolicibacterium peregrinum]
MPDEQFLAALSAIQIPPGMTNGQKLKDELIRREKTSTSTTDGDALVLIQLLAASQLEILHMLATQRLR